MYKKIHANIFTIIVVLVISVSLIIPGFIWYRNKYYIEADNTVPAITEVSE